MTSSRVDRVSGYLFYFALKPLMTAGFFVLVAFLWTLYLQHTFAYPFLFLFFGAVMGSAWFGGAIAGFLSVIFSTFTIAYFFVPPLYSWSIDSTAETYFVAFIVCASAVSWMSSTKKKTEIAIREARDTLEQRVQERTAELERSNAEIRENERRLRLLTETIPQQIWSAGDNGQVEYCNQHLLAYVGRSIDQMKGDEFFSVVHPEDLQSFRQTWNNAFGSESKFECECRVRRADGQYRWFLVRGTAQQSNARDVAAWYGTHIEIEEWRQTEQALQGAQSELTDLARTLSMGELAASIMHEINQPLTAVVTHAYACREWLHSNPVNIERAHSTAERIVQEGTRASDVVARVRALFQNGVPIREILDINAVIRNFVRLLRDEALRRDVAIHTELESDLPKVEADRVQIEQVLLNLVMNGIDAMSSIQGPRKLLVTSTRENSSEILIRVEDHGTGLDPAIKEKIFNPFFTTKAHGIGMGLSISRSIIEAHDGRLWASPGALGGTVFQFTIPVSS